MSEIMGLRRSGLLGSDRPAIVVRAQRDAAQQTQLATQDKGVFQYTEGIQETLSWALGELGHGPSGEPSHPDDTRLYVEIALMKRYALDSTSPAHHFAGGAMSALLWLSGESQELPVTWSNPPKTADGLGDQPAAPAPPRAPGPGTSL